MPCLVFVVGRVVRSARIGITAAQGIYKQEPLNPRTYHGKIRISVAGRFWTLLLQ
jgi:hypothetical protein